MSDKQLFGQALVDQAEEYLKQLNGSAIPQLKENRQAALSVLKEIGFPGPKAEEYKFTKLTKAIEKNFDLAKSSTYDLPTDLIEDIRKKHEGANVLFFVNGEYHAEQSVVVSGTEELTIESLAAYADKNDLSSFSSKSEDTFSIQNDVHANSGVAIEVKKNQVVSIPVISYYISAGEGAGFVKNLYVAAENSQAEFVHFHLSVGTGKVYTNEYKKYIVKANAQVNLFKIQDESESAVFVGNTDVFQERDSRFSSHLYTFNGELVRNNLNIEVNGEGCESNMFGLYLTKGKTHVDNHTVVDHKVPNSNSNELYKGIMDDQSRGVFNGKIFVREDAQKTNAFQSNGNILLSDKAIVNTKPQLEIWADDVKCSHGCTTGQLDEEAIFYLQARGISKDKAVSMILLANAAEVIEKIGLGWLKVEVTDKVIERLNV